MTTEVLGNLSFSEIPTVNGAEVMLNAGGVPEFLSDITANRPLAGTGPVGRIFLDTTLNRFYRDDGTAWIDLTPTLLLDGAVDQITVIDGTNVTPSIVSLADNPIIPGNEKIRFPTGTTAQRPASPVEGDARYSTTFDRPEIYSGAAWVPFGRILQVQTGTIAATSGTNQIPFDTSIPQITEGFQIWSASFTPLSSTSQIIVEYTLTVSHGTSTRVVITALFSGAANAIAASATTCAGANTPQDLTLYHSFLPGSTATINFSARLGSSANGTCFVGSGGANTLGGRMASTYKITEVI